MYFMVHILSRITAAADAERKGDLEIWCGDTGKKEGSPFHYLAKTQKAGKTISSASATLIPNGTTIAITATLPVGIIEVSNHEPD